MGFCSPRQLQSHLSSAICQLATSNHGHHSVRRAKLLNPCARRIHFGIEHVVHTFSHDNILTAARGSLAHNVRDVQRPRHERGDPKKHARGQAGDKEAGQGEGGRVVGLADSLHCLVSPGCLRSSPTCSASPLTSSATDVPLQRLG